MMTLRRTVICTVLIQHTKTEIIEAENTQPAYTISFPTRLHTTLRKNNGIESSFCDDSDLQKAISIASGREASHG